MEKEVNEELGRNLRLIRLFALEIGDGTYKLEIQNESSRVSRKPRVRLYIANLQKQYQDKKIVTNTIKVQSYAKADDIYSDDIRSLAEILDDVLEEAASIAEKRAGIPEEISLLEQLNEKVP